jgi:hypothetical protein
MRMVVQCSILDWKEATSGLSPILPMMELEKAADQAAKAPSNQRLGDPPGYCDLHVAAHICMDAAKDAHQFWERLFGPQRQLARIAWICRVNGVSGCH